MRLVIIGNSGSGKRTLAERIGEELNVRPQDLDLIHWHDDGRKRDEGESEARIAEIAAGTSWIMEGVTGGWPKSPCGGQPRWCGSIYRGTSVGTDCCNEGCGAA